MFEPRSVEVHGNVAPGFELVRKEFQKNFELGEELSAQLCIVYKGEIIVDLWGSKEDSSYTGKTLQCVYSCSKNLTALAIAKLVDRNLLDYTDPVCKHWPEFALNDSRKSLLTVADVLRHEAGLQVLSKPISIEDCYPEMISSNAIGQIIEQEALNFPDGEYRREYHYMTRGFILQEILRRVDPEHRTIGKFLKQTVFDPLGINIHIGMEEKLQESSNISDCVKFNEDEIMKQASAHGRDDIVKQIKDTLHAFSFDTVNKIDTTTWAKLDMHFWNSSQARRAEIPSRNALTNAHDLAVIAGLLSTQGSDQILSQEVKEKMHQDPTVGYPLGGLKTFFTQGGVNHFLDGTDYTRSAKTEESGKFKLWAQQIPARMYGWNGYGGSVHVWDREMQIGFAYVPTYLAWYERERKRAVRCLKALYECLEK